MPEPSAVVMYQRALLDEPILSSRSAEPSRLMVQSIVVVLVRVHMPPKSHDLLLTLDASLLATLRTTCSHPQLLGGNDGGGGGPGGGENSQTASAAASAVERTTPYATPTEAAFVVVVQTCRARPLYLAWKDSPGCSAAYKSEPAPAVAVPVLSSCNVTRLCRCVLNVVS